MAKEKILLFSLTAKDFEVQTFCTGGAGGQHRNAKKNGVRIIHTASGARAEHRDGRDQYANKEKAFYKLAATKEFLSWHKAHTAKLLGQPSIEDIVNARVDAMMLSHNLKIEECSS